jgi:hypothetical protein
LNGVGGRTIAEAKECMSAPEFAAWRVFFQMHPFDDFHRYHRTAAAVCQASGGKYDSAIEFLAPEPVPPGMTQADFNTIRAMKKVMG